jgi:S-(hydroxymethyl)mycothiol dehydrogenase
VAVLSCGGVGTAAVACAALAGATTIIGVDLDDAKLATAQDFGATHTVNARGQDPVEAIRALTGGYGVDLVIDAVGIAATFRQAFEARDLPAGWCWSACQTRAPPGRSRWMRCSAGVG